jgi:hypothetical protein
MLTRKVHVFSFDPHNAIECAGFAQYFLWNVFIRPVNRALHQVKIERLERWMSGLSHTPGKRAWG